MAKADVWKGKRKVKDQWEEEPYEVEHQVAEGVPTYLVKNQEMGRSQVLHWKTPLCMVVQVKWAQCNPTTLEEQTPERSETDKVPKSVN